MNRRGFFSTMASAAVAPAVPCTNQQKRGGMCLVGRWMIASQHMHFADDKTAYIRDMMHDGPQFKFPAGIPERGDPVKVFVNWDICIDRGARKHRPLAKLILRVKPIAVLRDDAELHVLNVRPLDGQEYRELFPVCLNPERARDWWMIRRTPATSNLADRAARNYGHAHLCMACGGVISQCNDECEVDTDHDFGVCATCEDKRFVIESRINGAWTDDAIGENEPRRYEECEADIASFRAGDCGPDFVNGEYRIVELR